MNCCSRGGPKRTPTTLRPSSWASATARSLLSILPSANWKLRDTPRSRSLLARALRKAQQFAGAEVAHERPRSCRQGTSRRKVIVGMDHNSMGIPMNQHVKITSSEHMRAGGRESSRLGFDPERLARVRAAILSDIEHGRCHGVALRVARHGSIVLDVCEGYADRAAGTKLQPNAVFATMSVAKQFTNVLTLSLVERGLLKLHAPVAEVIPEFGTLGKEKVNLYHLLTHTSGVLSAAPPVPPEVLTNIEALVRVRVRAAARVAAGRARQLLATPRAFDHGGDVPARRRPRAELRHMLREDLFEPLGMRDTSLGLRGDLAARFCPGARRRTTTSCRSRPRRRSKEWARCSRRRAARSRVAAA